MKPLLLALAALMLPGQDPKGEEGFTPIFTGKDLAGWVYGRKAGGEHRTGAGFAADNGVIFCTPKDGGDLYTEREYGDFTLRFDVKLTENAGSGIAIRAPLEGDPAYAGLKVQVLDNAGSQYKNLRPEQYHGSVYDIFAAKPGALKPVGEWNTEEIAAKGRRVTVTVNGQVVLDVNLDDCRDEGILRKHPGLRNLKGHIGLLGHGSRVDFRNLRIKEL